MKRSWRGVDLATYFRKNFPDVKSRAELRKRDHGFYQKLAKQDGLLDEVLPSKNANHRDWSGVDLVAYFREHYSDVESRSELQKCDASFYQQLSKIEGLMDSLLFEKNRSWFGVDLVAYFRKNYPDVKSRGELAKRDHGFYRQLCNNKGLLDEVLPEKRKKRETRNWDGVDLVAYFRKNYSDVKSRAELQKRDSGFYGKLYENDGRLLDEVLPEKRNPRDWSNINLVAYFRENYSDVKSRKELEKRDPSFYRKLSNTEGLLDEVLPEKRKMRDWFGVDLVEYFRQHYSDVKNREELKKRDQGFHFKLCNTKSNTDGRRLIDVLFSKQEKSLDTLLVDFIVEGDSNE